MCPHNLFLWLAASARDSSKRKRGECSHTREAQLRLITRLQSVLWLKCSSSPSDGLLCLCCDNFHLPYSKSSTFDRETQPEMIALHFSVPFHGLPERVAAVMMQRLQRLSDTRCRFFLPSVLWNSFGLSCSPCSNTNCFFLCKNISLNLKGRDFLIAFRKCHQKCHLVVSCSNCQPGEVTLDSWSSIMTTACRLTEK